MATTAQRRLCPGCGYSTATKAGDVLVDHTVNGQRIRKGVRKDGRKCRKSGKAAVR